MWLGEKAACPSLKRLFLGGSRKVVAVISHEHKPFYSNESEKIVCSWMVSILSSDLFTQNDKAS
jgi:hypothetical protein